MSLPQKNLVDLFLNKKVVFTLIESLPKDKTQVLGTAEVRLSPFVKCATKDPQSDAATNALLPALSRKENAVFSYLNPRLLPPPSKDGEQLLPELAVEVSISNPLIRPEAIEAGNFITFSPEDFLPVPDEWTTKEGTEKDLNSSQL
ncbi:hypothetical protein HK405_010123 [Cladochytrium tenue]|nr:hypothetical protein HK405_010123 [Cladochytrium tenue]